MRRRSVPQLLATGLASPHGLEPTNGIPAAAVFTDLHSPAAIQEQIADMLERNSLSRGHRIRPERPH